MPIPPEIESGSWAKHSTDPGSLARMGKAALGLPVAAAGAVTNIGRLGRQEEGAGFFDIPEGLKNAWKMNEADIEERLTGELGDNFIERLLTDMRDNGAGILDVAAKLVGAQSTEDTKKPTWEYLAGRWEEGAQAGEAFGGGAAVFLGKLVTSPGDTLSSRPFTFALFMLPAWRAAKAAGKLHPKLLPLLERVEQAEAVLRRAPRKVVADVAAGLKGVLDDIVDRHIDTKYPPEVKARIRQSRSAEIEARMDRWLDQNLVQASGDESLVMNQIFRDGSEIAKEIVGDVGGLAAEVRRGFKPADAIRPEPLAPEVPPLETAGEVRGGPVSTGAAYTPEPATELLHGTSRKFDRFDPSVTNRSGRKVSRFYFTDNPEVAKTFSNASGFQQVTADAFADRLGIEPVDAIPQLRSQLDAAIAEGKRLAYVDEAGVLNPAESAAAIPRDALLDGDVRLYDNNRWPRVVKEHVRGRVLDLTDPRNIPDDLRYVLEREAIYRPWENGPPGFGHEHSTALLEYMRRNGYGVARVSDTYESGFQSYLVLPEKIGRPPGSPTDAIDTVKPAERPARKAEVVDFDPDAADPAMEAAVRAETERMWRERQQAEATPEAPAIDDAPLPEELYPVDDVRGELPDLPGEVPLAPPREVSLPLGGTIHMVRTGQRAGHPRISALRETYAKTPEKHGVDGRHILLKHIREGKVPASLVNDPDLAAAAYYFGDQYQSGNLPKVALDHPVIKETIGRAAEALDGLLSPKDLVLNTMEPELRLLQDRLPSERLVAQDWANIMVGSIADTSPQLLRSKAFRADFLQRATKAGLARKAAIKRIKTIADDLLLPDAANFVIELRGGKTVDLAAILLDTVKANKESMAAVQAEVLNRMAGVVGAKAARARIIDAFGDQLRRVTGDTIPEYVQSLINEVIINERPLPPAILGPPGADGVTIARHLTDMKGRLVKELVAAGMEESVAAQKIADLAGDLIGGYKKPSKILREEFARLSNERPLIPEETPAEARRSGDYRDITAVRQGIDHSWAWLLQDMAVDSQTGLLGFMDRFIATMKMNYTVRNLPTLIRNYGSWVQAGSVAFGKTPIETIFRDIKTGRLERQYRAGKVSDPKIGGLMREADRLGVADGTLVDAELGGMEGAAGFLGKGVSVPAEVVKRVNAAMAKGYRMGDNIPKKTLFLDKATETLDFMDAMEPGTAAEFTIRKGQTVVVRKTTEGMTVENATAGWRPVSEPMKNARPLDEQGRIRIAAREGKFEGERFLFDYPDRPILLQAVRASRVLQLVASPFLTWFFKASDLSKRGLVSEVLTGPRFPNTNSRAINAYAAKQLADFTARRSMLMAGARADLLGPENRRRRDMLKYLPRDVGMILTTELANPRYIGFLDLKFADYAEPSEIAIRALGGGMQSVVHTLHPGYDFDWLWERDAKGIVKDLDARTDLDPEEKQKIAQRRAAVVRNIGRQVWGWQDVFLMAGATGNPIAEFIFAAFDADKQNRPIHWQRFGAGLIGGSAVKTIDVAIGAVDPRSTLSTRRWAVSEDPDGTEEGIKWAFRTMVGLGWRIEEVGNTPFRTNKIRVKGRGRIHEHVRRVKAAMGSDLTRAIKGRIEEMGKEYPLDQEQIERAYKKLYFYRQVIEAEAVRVTRDLNELREPWVGNTTKTKETQTP